MADGITEIDINAYIDGELDDERRLHVEDWLAHHPDAAAQVRIDDSELNSDLHASARYRAQLISIQTQRAVAQMLA